MISMDFTMTACNRADIINTTLESFHNNLLDVDWDNCSLIINVDPIPKMKDGDADNIHNICCKYFKSVQFHIPEEPNYTAAYKWIYKHATTKLIFNLEDDWMMLKPISITKLTDAFDKYPFLYASSFRAYPHRYISIPTSPQVLHSRFYKAVGEGLNPSINPEIQLRAEKIPGLLLPNKRPEHGRSVNMDGKGYIWPEQIGVNHIVVSDIGRYWISKQPFKKPDNKETFTTWIS